MMTPSSCFGRCCNCSTVAWHWIAGLQCGARRSFAQSGKQKSRAKSGGKGWKGWTGQSLPGCFGVIWGVSGDVCWHHLFWHCQPFFQWSKTIWRHVNIWIFHTVNFMNSLMKHCIVHEFLVFTPALLKQWESMGFLRWTKSDCGISINLG